MSTKRTNKPKPTASFEDLVAKQTVAKFEPAIRSIMAQVLPQAIAPLSEHIQNLYLRVVSLEKLLLENVESIDENVLVNSIAQVEDDAQGLALVDREVQKGDTVRMTLQVHNEGAWTQPTKHSVSKFGSGSLSVAVEEKVISFKTKAGESVEFDLELDGEEKRQVRVVVDRVSAPKVVEVPHEVI